MKRSFKNAVFAVTALMLAAPTGAYALAERYGVILDRLPFGQAPTKVEAPKPQPKPEQTFTPAQLSFAAHLRLYYIRDSEVGLRTGIADSKTKWSAVLGIGESLDGIMLIEADYDAGKVLLEKEGVQAWIYLDGSKPTTVTGEAARPAIPSPVASTARPMPVIRRAPRTRGTPLTKEEYQRSRANGTRQPPVSPIKALRGNRGNSMAGLTREEREQKLREYNMELIRAGGAKGIPLPIQLTPEEDAQLVNEGVLPAQ